LCRQQRFLQNHLDQNHWSFEKQASIMNKQDSGRDAHVWTK
jgi:hypothetical protein